VARVVADTHALLWMLKGTLRERSSNGAEAIEQALDAKALCVSIGSFLDLRYLVDSGRLAEQALDDARSIVNGDAFIVVPLDLRVLDKMAAVPRERCPIPSTASSPRPRWPSICRSSVRTKTSKARSASG
jgi:PIN domain nuclease of toxin-antitoxin system